MGFLPPPQIVYPYGKSSPSMLSQYYICVGRRFAIEGEGFPYGIIPFWGSSAMGFLLGEGLPYGIPSGERLLYGINSGGRGGGGG